jgi:hypothetical protein
MRRKDTVVIGLLGAMVGLLVVLTIQLSAVNGAQGQGAAAESSGFLMGTGDLSGSASVCFIFDTKQTKLGLYTARGAKGFEFSGMRQVNFDFSLIEYPRGQQPSVEAVRAMLKKSGEKEK